MTDHLPPGLLDWVADTVGAPVTDSAVHPASGRSRLIWLIEAGERKLLLRSETGLGPFAGTEFTLGREAGVLRALHTTNIPVPAVRGLTADGRTVLMDLLPGTAEIDLVSPAGQALLASYCCALAELHRLDPCIAPLPVPSTPSEQAILDIGAHRRSYRLCPAHPVAERALETLVDHTPAGATRASLLHGDAGPGNFLHADGRVTGLIDWEMAHVGDPMDDLAWLWFRIAVLPATDGDPDAALAAAYRAYRDAAGSPLDFARIDYYGLVVLTRCLVATLTRQRNNPRNSPEPVERMTRLVEVALDNRLRTGKAVGGALPALPKV